jgi:formylglycine-generating enzyme required for sulfatase activity
MRLASALVVAICSMWLTSQPAFATKRVALVIGNSAYQNVAQLANPANDAAAMAAMLKGAGFDVVQLQRDLKANDMRRALRDFTDDVRDADVAIVYYAGHGIEINGTNYLIPVDALLERDIDAYDEAIPLDRILTVVDPAKKLLLVILDACRDNPFSKAMKHNMASRSVTRGLSRIDPSSPNTLIAYAAKAGSTAADGEDKNSPFTTALVKYLPRPGLDLRMAFGFVRDDVLKATHNRQEPFVYGSLGGDDVALVPAGPLPASQIVQPMDPNASAREDYELALEINVVSAWDSYISRYPSGFYTDLAIAQRNKLRAAKAAAAEEARLAAANKAADEAKAAESERARVAAQAKAKEDAKVAAEQAKAAEQARIAEQAKTAEQAKAAREREALEKQKAIEEAKTAEAKAAEAARAKAASDQAAAQAANDKAAEAARAKAVSDKAASDKAAALAASDKTDRIAALMPQDIRPGREAPREQAPGPSGCAGTATRSATLAQRTAQPLSASEECTLKPKDTFRECENCPEMVMVPAGEVLMGSERSDIDNGIAAANEAPQHKAVIRQPIAIGRFEVTREQYATFVKDTGYTSGDRCFTFENNMPQERTNRSFLNPGYVQDGNHPAVCVSWVNAKAYVDWLSRTTGKSYRLLSEAEFEYAARAGSGSRYGFSNDPAEICKFANGADQSAKSAGLPANSPYMNCRDGYPFTAPVGSFTANAFGLYDVIGNVWEWTEDCFYGDYASAKLETASRSAEVCSTRTVRGGDWFSTESSLRPAVRAKANADAHYDDIGFRVVRTLTP